MYAPAGSVQVHVRTDRPVSVAVLVLDNGQQIAWPPMPTARSPVD
jgi:hypothetical protein